MKIKNGELKHIDYKEIREGVYVVPDGVRIIGAWVFSGHVSLRRVVLPETVEVIRENAFWGCTGLEEINLPASIREIGPGAFQNCTRLRCLRTPDVPVIDVQTGTELRPGDPGQCLGGDNHPEHPLCCDGCDCYLLCFPEAMPV